MGKRGPQKNLSGHPLYKTWATMRTRCNNKMAANYSRYGGRGISVCERWKIFENFLLDMGPRPSPKHSLDRIDNDGNYEPSNCRWATRLLQMSNCRQNLLITIAGKTKHLAEWSRDYNTSPSTTRARMLRGMSWEEALTTPPNSRARPKSTSGIRGVSFRGKSWGYRIMVSGKEYSRSGYASADRAAEAANDFRKENGIV